MKYSPTPTDWIAVMVPVRTGHEICNMVLIRMDKFWVSRTVEHIETLYHAIPGFEPHEVNVRSHLHWISLSIPDMLESESLLHKVQWFGWAYVDMQDIDPDTLHKSSDPILDGKALIYTNGAVQFTGIQFHSRIPYKTNIHMLDRCFKNFLGIDGN